MIALAQRVSVFKYMARDLLFQASINGLMLGLAPIVVLAADFALPAIVLLFLPILAVHRGGREAIAKEHQALHDALTGPARTASCSATASTSRSAPDVATATPSVVMLMDLDHFKEINDTLGHHMGDLLLQEVSRRLQRALRDSDTVARLGGDEFGVLLPHVDSQADATSVAQNLLAHLREPFVLEGMRLEIDASIGIALHPMHGEDNETLQQRADIAMYSAKQLRPRPRDLRARARPPLAAPPRARGRDARRRSTRARSSSTTSPRRTCAPAGSWAPRRSRAGITRSSGSSARASSCRSPSRPA